jgi:hypothetical protein
MSFDRAWDPTMPILTNSHQKGKIQGHLFVTQRNEPGIYTQAWWAFFSPQAGGSSRHALKQQGAAQPEG